jgi:hypothetical protein
LGLSILRTRLGVLVTAVAVLSLGAFLSALGQPHSLPAIGAAIRQAAIQIVADHAALWS